MNHFYVLLLFIIGLYSCNPLYYQSDFLVEVNPHEFGSYYTEVECDKDVDPIIAQRIQNAIDFNARRLGYVSDDNGDLLVKYLIKNTSKQYVEECINEYQRFGGGEFCRERLVTYKEGSLIIDIIDTNTNEIVWHAAAYGPSFNDWKDTNEKVNNMVASLFDRYYSTNP